MATSEEMDLVIRSIAMEILHRFVPIEAIPGDNEYEKASNRFNNINTAFPTLHRLSEMIDEIANEEYDNATQALRECEKMPGIPLDKYNKYLA